MQYPEAEQMDPSALIEEMLRRRLANQRLVGDPFASPAAAVEQLGAVQAQDYAGAKWALSQRTGDVNDAAMEQELDDGLILRTHVLRPTWHLVSPRDIRWMLELSAPRVRALAAYNWRSSELDAAVFKRSNTAIEKALDAGVDLTRAELALALRRARVDPGDGQRLGHIVLRAELDGVICSGARRGKQFTYALLDRRAPGALVLERDEALRELAIRYFSTRGPATVHDFAWWSGLTVTDARTGTHSADDMLVAETMGDDELWSGRNESSVNRAPSVHLLPNYDEFLVAYGDRAAMVGALDDLNARGKTEATRAIFSNVIEIDGRVAGNWKRTIGRSSVALEQLPFRDLTAAESSAIAREARRFANFLGLELDSITAA